MAAETTVPEPTPDTDPRFGGKPVFWATFHERERWVESAGIRHQARANGEIARPICRLLVEAGHPDGVLRFRNQDGKSHFWVQSIYITGSEQIDSDTGDSETDVVKAPRAPKNNAVKAPTAIVHSERGAFVFVNVDGERVRVNPKHRDAFDIIVNAPDTWETAVHGKTRGYLLHMNWVTDKPSLTPLGERIMQAANEVLAAETP